MFVPKHYFNILGGKCTYTPLIWNFQQYAPDVLILVFQGKFHWSHTEVIGKTYMQPLRQKAQHQTSVNMSPYLCYSHGDNKAISINMFLSTSFQHWSRYLSAVQNSVQHHCRLSARQQDTNYSISHDLCFALKPSTCTVLFLSFPHFFFLSSVHLGQYHLPLGFAVKFTHPKWNHSMGHWNMRQINKLKWLWILQHTYINVVFY